MSYIYHSDYTTSDYWNPILYPQNNVYSNILYNQINNCIHKEKKYDVPTKEYSDGDEKIYFCNLTPTINAYNDFLKNFTIIYNLIMDEYNKILQSIKDINVNEPIVDNWIKSINPFHREYKNFLKIEFVPLDIDVSHLIVCDKVFDIIDIIKKNVDEFTILLKNISNFDMINPTAFWNNIYIP